MSETNYKKAFCVHFHIYKNGGSTIDWILEKNFATKALKLDNFDNPSYVIPWDIVINYIEESNNPQSFSSHQIRFPMPPHFHYDFIPIIFLRNPIKRAISVYYDQKTLSHGHLPSSKAKTSTLKEFIEWALQANEYTLIDNVQVSFLQPPGTIIASDLDFQATINHLTKCPILGVVERFDESLVLAEEVLRKHFKNIDLSYIPQNVNKNKSEMWNDLQDIRRELGTVYDELMDRNSLDFKAYAIVEKELDCRINKIENFEKKLQDFIKRCQELKEAQNMLPGLRDMINFEKKYNQAELILQELLQRYPNHPEFNYLYAFSLQQQNNDLRRCILYYNRAYEKGFDAIWVLYHRGLAYCALGEFNNAMKDLTKARFLNPQNIMIMVALKEIKDAMKI